MKRTTRTFTITDTANFKQQMLGWCSQFNICCFLDNHAYQSNNPSLECLVAIGVFDALSTQHQSLEALDLFVSNHPNDWIVGHLGYDVKNQVEALQSSHPDGIGFPDLFFFVPETVIQLSDHTVTIASYHSAPDQLCSAILQTPVVHTGTIDPIPIRARMDRETYISIVQQLQKHILRGDCYEINFCQEFYAEHTIIDPIQVYQRLTALSPTPFACYYRLNHRHLLCASPERFLKKTGKYLYSQPIKGTIRRNNLDGEADAKLMGQLRESEKDKSENVMVVDLVRNDLSRICKEGSVSVTELFGIYSFPQVHQMISTIRGEILDNLDFTTLFKATFPMGSMTGAPKKRVMELIEQYEQTKRGLYSGAVGYINPAGDFDFNVVIRSILYNAQSNYLSYQVGGGITYYSDAAKEYEECLLKAAAIRKVLGNE